MRVHIEFIPIGHSSQCVPTAHASQYVAKYYHRDTRIYHQQGTFEADDVRDVE